MKYLLFALVAGTLIGNTIANNSTHVDITCPESCLSTTIGLSICSELDVHCQCNDEHFQTRFAECLRQRDCITLANLAFINTTATACELVEHHDGYILQIITGVFGPVVVLTTVIRLIPSFHTVKLSNSSHLSADNTLILIATINIVWLSAAAFRIVELGMGEDVWRIYDRLEEILKLYYVTTIFYVFIGTITRLSILLFYRRILTTSILIWLNYVLMGLSILYGLIYIPMTIFQCVPVSDTWEWQQDTDRNSGRCIDVVMMYRTMAAMNMILDIMVFLLPVPLLFQLRISLQSRLQTLAMFCAGFLVTAASAVRLVLLPSRQAAATNFTYAALPVTYWSVIEMDVGIICANMPGVRAALKSMFSNQPRPCDATTSKQQLQPSDNSLRSVSTSNTVSSSNNLERAKSQTNNKTNSFDSGNDTLHLYDSRKMYHEALELPPARHNRRQS